MYNSFELNPEFKTEWSTRVLTFRQDNQMIASHCPLSHLNLCKETDISHKVCLFVCVQPVNIFRTCISSLSLTSPNIILHSMHMSHSCVPRGIICSRWQIKRGRKCRFIYEWVSCLSRTLALLRLLIFVMHIPFSESSVLSLPAPHYLLWQPQLLVIVCFCFILSIISCYYWTWLKRRCVVLCCYLTQVQ